MLSSNCADTVLDTTKDKTAVSTKRLLQKLLILLGLLPVVKDKNQIKAWSLKYLIF